MSLRLVRLSALAGAALFANPAQAQRAPVPGSVPGSGPVPGTSAVPPAAADPLRAGFEVPPESARPRVRWHRLSGNVSQDGITKNLEWMKRVGIAGAMMFDGDMGAPRIVPERVTVLSPA